MLCLLLGNCLTSFLPRALAGCVVRWQTRNKHLKKRRASAALLRCPGCHWKHALSEGHSLLLLQGAHSIGQLLCSTSGFVIKTGIAHKVTHNILNTFCAFRRAGWVYGWRLVWPSCPRPYGHCAPRCAAAGWVAQRGGGWDIGIGREQKHMGGRKRCWPDRATCFPWQRWWTWFSSSICDRQSSQNNSMQNKQLRADENRANNIVIRKRAKAQIAVPSVKGEVREGKWLHSPCAAGGTPTLPCTASPCLQRLQPCKHNLTLVQPRRGLATAERSGMFSCLVASVSAPSEVRQHIAFYPQVGAKSNAASQLAIPSTYLSCARAHP